MQQFAVATVFRLSAQGIQEMVDRLRDIPEVTDVIYLPQTKAFRVIASTTDRRVHLEAIKITSNMVRAIDSYGPEKPACPSFPCEAEQETGDDAAMRFKRATGADGRCIPLTEAEKLGLRNVLIPKKIRHKPFTAVWNGLIYTKVWQPTIGHSFKQFATFQEGLKALSAETGTVLEVDAAMQTVYVGANNSHARDDVISRINVLNTIPFGYARPINMITPPMDCLLCVRPLALDGLTAKTFVNPGSRSPEDAYRDVYRAKRISPLVEENTSGPKIFLTAAPPAQRTSGHLPARQFFCVAPDGRYNSLEDALSRLNISPSDKLVASDKPPVAPDKSLAPPRFSSGLSWAAAAQKTPQVTRASLDHRPVWQAKAKTQQQVPKGKQHLVVTPKATDAPKPSPSSATFALAMPKTFSAAKFGPSFASTATTAPSSDSSAKAESFLGPEKRAVFLDPVDSSVEMNHERSFFKHLGGAGAAWLDRSGESRAAFMASLNATIRKMMTRVRLCPGDIRVSVVFGRLMIHDFNHEVIPLLSKIKTPVPMRIREFGTATRYDVLAVMNSSISGRQPRVDFTPIITTSVDDIRAFELGIERSARLEFSSTSTYYDFSCRAGADEFIISIKATKALETSLKFAPARSEMCRLNAHCVDRLFDFRVVVTVNDTARLKRSYGAFAEWLRKSLEVKVDPYDPMKVSLVYPNVDEESLKITSASVRGIHIFRDLSQTHNLEIRFTQPFTSSYVENGTKILALSPAMLSSSGPSPGTHSSGLPQQWYEISMYSSDIQKAVRENRNLSLGKEPGWKAKEVDADNMIGKFTDVAMAVGDNMNYLGNSGATNGFERLEKEVEFEPWAPTPGLHPSYFDTRICRGERASENWNRDRNKDRNKNRNRR